MIKARHVTYCLGSEPGACILGLIRMPDVRARLPTLRASEIDQLLPHQWVSAWFGVDRPSSHNVKLGVDGTNSPRRPLSKQLMFASTLSGQPSRTSNSIGSEARG